ncbi:cation-transporting ATPase 13A3-like 1 [Homarus americanus]|uniref:Cation-transporting ATPase n=1 Tax=Homarus americanus TaxID=6706 RepID=A0A8J5JS91_HOMAM|nr:cation-transporting ATPase 13A3-like 1 [Homarus americanus]
MTYDRLGEVGDKERGPPNHCRVIQQGTEEELTLYGYQNSACKAALFYLLTLITLGIFYLISYWKPEWRVYWKSRKSALSDADALILKDADGQIHVAIVESETVESGFPSQYVVSSHSFNGVCNGAHNGASDVTHLTQPLHRQILYGLNMISVEVKSYWHLLVTEILNPFYVFQIASITLWSFDNYVLYATCIFLVSCLSIIVSLHETRKQSQSVHDMVEASNTSNISILRATPEETTGESVPVTKTPITLSEENEIYLPKKHKRHTLFCGTSVIQTRYYGSAQVLAVVVRTGFNTAKGELVRSILYPRPLDFKFYKDAMKFILLLFFIASIGMSYSIYIYILHKEGIVKTIVRTLDIVTIVVPPALPAAMTVGTYYAQSRLKKKGIFCISPPRINVSGKTKLVCFDKTGTLTEDGLEVWGVVEVEGSHMGTPVMDVSSVQHTSHLVAAMATCHSLTYLNGQLTGDPLDVKMFEATKWALEEPVEDDTHRFDNLIPTLVRPPASSLPSSPISVSSIPPPLPPSISTSPTHGTTVSTSPPPSAIVSIFPPPPPPSTVSTSPPPGITVSTISPPPGTIVSAHTPLAGSTLVVHTLTDGSGGGTISVDGLVDLQDVSLLQQSLEEPTQGSSNYDQMTPAVVKPSNREMYMDPPNITNIVETPFQVPYEIGIVRQFPFSSSSQRMSVIVRMLGQQHMDLYAKGAPEVIQSLCRPESVPDDLGPILTQYTVECDLTFVGLLILQNMLKPETKPVICQLQKANIRTVMVTGDNILTAISVARDCCMVGVTDHVYEAKVTPPTCDHPSSLTFEPADSPDMIVHPAAQDVSIMSINMDSISPKYHFAVTGKAWALICQHFPDLVPRIIARGTVFARMSPDQKAQLVEELQAINYIVAMCGDGANDCGALKAAHVGISLSEAEASVAAPFTSHTNNIECVPQVICEGRCALTTNFSVFKYMALYSIIQFVSVLILYSAYTNLSDPQFLYIDLFIVTVIAIFMGYTGPNLLADSITVNTDSDDPIDAAVSVVMADDLNEDKVLYFLASSRSLKKCFQWLMCKREPKNKYKTVLRDMDEDPSWPPIGTPVFSFQGT